MLLAATLLPVTQEKPVSYHDRLLEMCEGKAGYKCCRASVHAMRREQARLKPEDEDCPSGLHPMSLACPASFNWCSFKSVEEVRGGEARGEALK